LFGNQTLTNNRTELFMFITPRVVENELDLRNVIDDLRRRMGRLEDEFPRVKTPPATARASSAWAASPCAEKTLRPNARRAGTVSDWRQFPCFDGFRKKASLIPDILLLLTRNTRVRFSFDVKRQLTLTRYFYSLRSRIGAPSRAVAVVVRSLRSIRASRKRRLTLQGVLS
jgi:hypothetical protein